MKRIAAYMGMIIAGWLGAGACTSAIVGSGVEKEGRILLWKHRDSGHKDNVVERIEPADGMRYVGLFNAEDRGRKEAWAGFNEAGFAVMNTASYNLAPDTAKVKDREGLVMTEALKKCRRAEEFTAMLDSLLATGKPLGVQANFGVTDRDGNGLYVETTDWGYRVYNLEDEAKGWMVRTNYSYSGGDESRLGEMRHQTAVKLIGEATEKGKLDPEMITGCFSKSFYHYGKGMDMLESGKKRIEDKGELIVRRSSCASVVIGTQPGGETEMWVIVGNPATGRMRRVTMDNIPKEIQGDGTTGRSEDCDRANRLRDKGWRKGKRGWIMDLDFFRGLD